MRWGGKIGLNCGPHPDLPWPGEGLALGEQVTQTEKVFVRGFRETPLLLWQLTIRPQPWENHFPCVCVRRLSEEWRKLHYCWFVVSRKGERHTLLTASPSSPLVCLPFLLLPITFLDVIPAIVSPQRPPPPSLGDSPRSGGAALWRWGQKRSQHHLGVGLGLRGAPEMFPSPFFPRTNE